ncbi:winged helix-turn-helix transcriptional regulator [Sphingobium sp. CR28]|uniref:winged helix-turn-helix transcriptional regulator n=1 Tax=Sphingobium sp. CR28 TaxID=3400272 RepID=UPI003FEE1580
MLAGNIDVTDRIAVDHSNCRRVTPVLARVGDKWSILTVMILAGGSKRFSELRRGIDGISQRMLTLTLRGLEREGFVARTVTPSIPPRVDYELTPLGRSLCEPVMALGGWVHDNLDAIDAARVAFDERCKNE